MPNAPNGTSPISTVRPDNFSLDIEPTPAPTENSASAKMYKFCVPPKLVCAYTGNCAVSTVPTNQNQLTPSTALRTAKRCRVNAQICSDARRMFQSTFNDGSPASTLGICRATVLPATAIAITHTAATCGPWLPAT